MDNTIQHIKELSKRLNNMRQMIGQQSNPLQIQYMDKDWCALADAEIFLDQLSQNLNSVFNRVIQ